MLKFQKSLYVILIKYSHITLPETAQYVTDIEEVLKDDSIQMVVELMGGTTFAKDCVEGALKG